MIKDDRGFIAFLERLADVAPADKRVVLKAKFHKSAHNDGSHDRSESRWSVYADRKLILNAPVKEITSNIDLDYDAIATVNFGKFLLKEIRGN